MAEGAGRGHAGLMSLRPVIDKKRFMELGYARGTWDELVRRLPAVRPNGEHGRKVFLYEDDVVDYMNRHTITPDPPRRRVAA